MTTYRYQIRPGRLRLGCWWKVIHHVPGGIDTSTPDRWCWGPASRARRRARRSIARSIVRSARIFTEDYQP